MNEQGINAFYRSVEDRLACCHIRKVRPLGRALAGVDEAQKVVYFTATEENVRRQMEKLRAHPWIPAAIAVRGFVYDVATGRLREVRA